MKDPRPGVTGTLRSYLTRLRHRGPAEVAGAVAGSVGAFRRSSGVIRFLERSTRQPGDEDGPDVVLREATPADAEAYARDIATDSRFTFVGRLGAGTECFLALESDRLVHASWVTTRAAWIGELGRYFTPDKGSAYVYESFTSPFVRGRGIYPAVLRHIARTLGERGVERVWIGVGADNAPSVRAIDKAGFEPGFDIGFEIRWGRIDIPTVTGPKAAQAERMIRKRLPANRSHVT